MSFKSKFLSQSPFKMEEAWPGRGKLKQKIKSFGCSGSRCRLSWSDKRKLKNRLKK